MWVLTAIVLLTLLLALARAWPHSYREEASLDVAVAWALFMVRTFSFHIGLGLLILTLLHVALRAWLRAFAALPALAICLAPTLAGGLGMLGVDRREPIVGETVRVMTFNVLGVNRAHDAVATEILRHAPDVVILQESNNVWHKALLLRLGARYPHVSRLAWNDWIGMSVFATRAIHNPTRVLEGHGRDALRFEIDLAGGSRQSASATRRRHDAKAQTPNPEPQTPDPNPSTPEPTPPTQRVAVYAIHPQHPVTLDNVRRSRHHFADLREAVRRESIPTMIVGDCNWDSNSPQDSALAREGFQDAHDLAGPSGGWTRGSTWCAKGWKRFFPGFRIDHVYLGPGLSAASARVGRSAGSDHRPVIADVGRAGP